MPEKNCLIYSVQFYHFFCKDGMSDAKNAVIAKTNKQKVEFKIIYFIILIKCECYLLPVFKFIGHYFYWCYFFLQGIFPTEGLNLGLLHCWQILYNLSHQFSSVQSLSHVQLFATPRTAAHRASLSITNSRSLLKLMSIESEMSSNHLILCHPLLLQPSTFPSIRILSNESVLRIR